MFEKSCSFSSNTNEIKGYLNDINPKLKEIASKLGKWDEEMEKTAKILVSVSNSLDTVSQRYEQCCKNFDNKYKFYAKKLKSKRYGTKRKFADTVNSWKEIVDVMFIGLHEHLRNVENILRQEKNLINSLGRDQIASSSKHVASELEKIVHGLKQVEKRQSRITTMEKTSTCPSIDGFSASLVKVILAI